MQCKQIGLGCVLLMLAAFSAGAIQLPDQYAGSDNAFEPTGETYEVDLGAAITVPESQTWATTPGGGNGVYDPAQWAVIFRYTSVTIPSGTTVTFKNNPTCAPVIWLVEGDVTIEGTVALNGQTGQSGTAGYTPTEPGPGGFRGGRGALPSASGPSAGFGPGGGAPKEPASFTQGVVVYSDEGCFPLIGGSGGGGGYGDSWSGGAGGGAILIAAQGAISIASGALIQSNGGTGSYDSRGGSGGMIRLVANRITGEGGISASGQTEGDPGRIRLEAKTNEFSGGTSPLYSFGIAEDIPQVLRDDTTPLLTVKMVGDQQVPDDPSARLRHPADVQLPEVGDAHVVVEGQNVPPGSTVVVRLVRADGTADSPELPAVKEVPLALTKSDGATSTWEGDLSLAGGYSALQAHAIFN